MAEKKTKGETGTSVVADTGTKVATKRSLPRFEVTSDGERITAMCSIVKADDQALRSKVAILCTSAILHAVKHSDITKIGEVIAALSDADGKHPWRMNAAAQWFVDKGPVAFGVKDDGKVDKSSLTFHKDKRARLAKIMEADEKMLVSNLLDNPFWKHKPEEKPYNGFNLQEALERVLNQAAKTQKKLASLSPEDQTKVVIDQDMLDAVKRIVVLQERVAPVTAHAVH